MADIEESSFGVLLDSVGSNKVNLIIQSIIGLGGAIAIEYFIFLKRYIDVLDAIPYIKPIAIAIVIFLFVHGAQGFLGLFMNRIKIYERGIIIGKVFRTKPIRNEQIDHFNWVITTYWAGFIPVGKRSDLTIFSKDTNSKLSRINSSVYSKLQKKMERVEERLEI